MSKPRPRPSPAAPGLGIVIPPGLPGLGINLAAVGLAELQPAPAPTLTPNLPSKYRNVPTIYNGLRYSSKAEAERAKFLDAVFGIGARYVRQPRFHLGCPENVYVADFLVWGVGDHPHVEDVKGARTAKFARDVKLWRAYGPCQLWIVTGKHVEYVNGGLDPYCIEKGTAGRSSEDKPDA